MDKPAKPQKISTLADLANNPPTIEEQLKARRKLDALIRAQVALLKSPSAPGVGRNIDKLRRECGWSYDTLSEKSGISKSLIIGHVRHGKPATTRIMKDYADAFSKQLGRSITPHNLTGE